MNKKHTYLVCGITPSLSCGTETNRWNWVGPVARGGSTPVQQVKAPSAAATAAVVASHECCRAGDASGANVRDFVSLPPFAHAQELER